MRDDDDVLACLRRAGKQYGKLRALEGLDLSLRAGQVTALLGANGAGKTTAIGLLLGLLRADSGSAALFGRDPRELSARRGIGVMLQSAGLPERLRVGELLAQACSYYPHARSVADCVALAGLDGLLDRRYGMLSGGQQRRVQFAIAVCGRPRLLFLDEPTVGLDLPARQRLWASVRMLANEGTAVVLTTHYLEEAGHLADRVCVLLRGRIVSDGSVDELRARVATRRIRCTSTLEAQAVAAWPGVRQVQREGAQLSALEVQAAGLDEAFCDLTRDDATLSSHLREAA